eukprot:CAMPEP_0201584634 /NCGR_PEP_ID=MMETSP0190_2-20130828/113121_1 /ASSEMBLY_ACC=CAM_ASM_000263 /TAXON_ID=37353 /ORGANISM="Rosalina sp." /LENGTH=599 /DNA_ID=CAMNT_0048029001 /DNA_START=45 /DNA_END=1844 /DNA_ORIENTATION=+
MLKDTPRSKQLSKLRARTLTTKSSSTSSLSPVYNSVALQLLIIGLIFISIITIIYFNLPDINHHDHLQQGITIEIEDENGKKIIDVDLPSQPGTGGVSKPRPPPSGSGSKTSSFDFDTPINANLKEQSSDLPGVFDKRMKIRETFIDAYNAYDKTCHGQDELVPIGPKCHNWVGMGLTIIDAVDTMYIMGLTDMLKEARDWMESSLSFNVNRGISFFETTIRCLGGLMSIYDLTKDKLYLDKALDLGQRMKPVFQTGTGMPLSEINLASGHKKSAGWTGGSVLLAEVGTIQLEFQSLSDRLDKEETRDLGDLASKVFETLDPEREGGPTLPLRGQYPLFLDSNSVRFRNNHISWGAMGDSFYEYLLKFWIYTGKKEDSRYRRMYVEAVEGMKETLWSFNTPSGLNYIAEWKGGRNDAKFDELACFTGGMLALGSYHKAGYTDEMNAEHLKMGEALGETCYQMFHRQKSGVSPEYVRFNDAGMQTGVDFYILRPETVESMMYLWRVTKDQKWRDKGWEIYENIVRSTKVESGGTGYAPVLSVGHNPHHDPKGVMHSFFLAETLKYLYMLFSDDQVIPLDKFVFNTEAHPVLIPDDTFAPK